jgi:hypothetical protein
MGLTAREMPCADDRGSGNGPASSNTRSTAPLRITGVRYFRPKVRLHPVGLPENRATLCRGCFQRVECALEGFPTDTLNHDWIEASRRAPGAFRKTQLIDVLSGKAE